MRFFTNEICFDILPAQTQYIESEKMYVLGNASFSQIWEHYQMAVESKIKGKAHMVFKVSDYKKVIEKLKSKFKLIEAAGGLVKKDEQFLFISRWKKWDLPKGKVEKGEEIELAAVREVNEECGIEVSLNQKIGETWHTYIQKGKDILKETHWYLMNCENDQNAKPQLEEDIEEIRWFTANEVESVAFNNTYESIKDIYNRYINKPV
ncbi:NUDIX hydrolase [Flexithrix dorotheae]|uniref:NUDIX hydrolase n=1 Tax=Flexithrix dorotheae TaxID=70993 RepID=UPI0003714D0C|nr:NUDIX domain-containing protein [Flexithrix dorotheae]